MPSSPYYVTDSGYPAYNPTKAKALVKQIENETGKPVAFNLSVDHLGVLGPGGEFLQADSRRWA